MHTSAVCFHNLEWPAPGARVRGPVLWLGGWIVGRAGQDFCDVRAISGGQTHLGVLGLPRTDLAAHFKSPRTWLPAEFVIGVSVSDGPADILLEAQDAFGAWHELQTFGVTVTSDGEASPREAGRIDLRPGGSWTMRGTHLPFYGHLDDPRTELALEHGAAKVFGWLLHEAQVIKTVWATTDLLVFNQLEHGVTDDALAAKVPSLPQARHARLRGATDVPPTLSQPACLRIYAALADGSVHLCLTQRLTTVPPLAAKPPAPVARPVIAHAALPALPSGRPRRLLLCTLNLQRDDSTLRALDIARHLTAGSQWGARLLTTTDGPLRSAFEAAGVSVQIVNPQPLFSANTSAAAEQALAELGRQIWLKHLDAVAVFDPPCLWAGLLGRRNKLPVLVDCSIVSPLSPPSSLSNAWAVASALVFALEAAAQCNSACFAGVPATLIPHWHSAELPVRQPGEPGQRHVMVAPVRGTAEHGAPTVLRVADWLTRHHPGFAAQHRLAITDLRDSLEEELFVRDAVLNQPSLMAIEPVSLAAATAFVCPAFSRPPVRAHLDAAAIGLPVITTVSPILGEIFNAQEVTCFVAGNPLALAHALVDVAANPTAANRRAGAAQRRVLASHAPQALLVRWQAALESMLAGAR